MHRGSPDYTRLFSESLEIEFSSVTTFSGRRQVAGGRWQVAGFDLALAFRKDYYNRLCVLDRDPTRRSVRYGSG